MFSYVALEDRIPDDHPLRAIRAQVDEVLRGMSARFDRLYADCGWPSISPERLLQALLLQVLYTVRSELLLMEQLDYNLLFRWFVGLQIDDRARNHTVFSNNRDRLLNQDMAQEFFAQVKAQAEGLMSDEHFAVDGTLIDSQKSFRPKDGGGGASREFRGKRRSNKTNRSRTVTDARLYRKAAGQESRLA